MKMCLLVIHTAFARGCWTSESVFTPIMIQGADRCWTLSNDDKSRIQSAEMRLLRTIVTKTRVRNEEKSQTVRTVLVLHETRASQ